MNATVTQPAPNDLAATRVDAVSSVQMPPRVYMRKSELAVWLGVGETTIEEWMRGKVIPVVKIKRVTLFRTDAVVRALERFTIKAVGDFQNS